MKVEFSKEAAFDEIINTLTKAADASTVSHQLKIYEGVMTILQNIADKNYEIGYMDAMQAISTIHQN
jgi:hypothetical protein